MPFDLALTLEPPQCQVCHTRIGLQQCNSCKLVFYCGRDHCASHQHSHKHPCNLVKNAVTALAREEDKREEVNRWNQASGIHPWAWPETPDYMQARYAVAEETLTHFKNFQVVHVSLENLQDMLRMWYGDNKRVHEVIPALFLRLGLDKECYNFIKFWAGKEHNVRHLALVNYPHFFSMDVFRANVLDSPQGLLVHPVGPNHLACMALIKVRILLDLQHMQNATRVLQGVFPRELIDMVRGHALTSSVVNFRKDIIQASLERTAELVELVKPHIKMLFDAARDDSPRLWSVLVHDKRPETILEGYGSGPDSDKSFLAVMCNYDAWRETPGAIGVLKALMKAA